MDINSPNLPTTNTHSDVPPPSWRLVNSFSTLENAQRLMNQLRSNGIEASLALINGVSVIAR